MIERDHQRHHGADGDLIVFHYRLFSSCQNAQNCHLGMLDDRSGVNAADTARIGDAKRSAPQIFQIDLPITGFGCQVLNIFGNLQDGLFIRIFHHGNHQTLLRIRSDADVIIVLVDNLTRFFIQ